MRPRSIYHSRWAGIRPAQHPFQLQPTGVRHYRFFIIHFINRFICVSIHAPSWVNLNKKCHRITLFYCVFLLLSADVYLCNSFQGILYNATSERRMTCPHCCIRLAVRNT